MEGLINPQVPKKGYGKIQKLKGGGEAIEPNV
jgi:hypothetical protein